MNELLSPNININKLNELHSQKNNANQMGEFNSPLRDVAIIIDCKILIIKG